MQIARFTSKNFPSGVTRKTPTRPILPTHLPKMTTSNFAFLRRRERLLLRAGVLAIFAICYVSHCFAQAPQSQTPAKKDESAPVPSTTTAAPNAPNTAPADAQKPPTLKQA